MADNYGQGGYFGSQNPQNRRASFELARRLDAMPSGSSLTALLKQACPVGTVRATIKDTADDGWLLDGQTVLNADTLYPELYALATMWQSAGSLVIPSGADAALMGHGTYGLGTQIGANAKAITTGQLPAHDHTIAHTHSINPPNTATTSDSHSHTVPLYRNTGSQSPLGTGYAWARAGGNTTTTTDSHSHSVNIAAFTSGASSAGSSGATGSGAAFDVTPKAFYVRYQIKADYV